MTNKYVQEKVSIITPAYNSEKYISKTIESVQKQTHGNWEMIIVDDCSTDKTCEIIKGYIDNDSRIRLIRHQNNQGAVEARNLAVKRATGTFIAYLDADDIWLPEKLKKQIDFMKGKQCAFSCTSYEVINDDGKSLNKEVYMLPKVDYMGYLTNNLLQTVGIMADISIIDREYFFMPDLRRGQDAATWLQVLKAGYDCYGMKEVLAQYRRTRNSLSSNKFKSVKRTWHLYRKVEKLSFLFACYCFARYAFLAVWKRIYIR